MMQRAKGGLCASCVGVGTRNIVKFGSAHDSGLVAREVKRVGINNNTWATSGLFSLPPPEISTCSKLVVCAL